MAFRLAALVLALACGASAFAPPMSMRLGGSSRRGIRGSSGWGSNGRALGKFGKFGGRLGAGDGDGGEGDGGGDDGTKSSGGAADDASSDDGKNPLLAAWDGYNVLLEEQPLLTKALTSLVGFSAGDYLAQKFVEKGSAYDIKRTLRMGSFGALVHGPTGHWFYGMLDGMIPGATATAVASKVAIDQVLWNPCFGIMFFSYLGLTEGKSPEQIVTKIKTSLKTAVTGSWAVWVPAHTINFRFVPPAQRLLYINSIQIGYNIFLSCLGNE